MIPMLAKNWWAIALRGLIAIIFGILAFLMPGLTLLTLVTLFGIYALIDGVLSVIAGVRSHGTDRRWWAEVLEGIAGIAFGVMTFIWPNITAMALLYLIAAWSLVTGVLEIVAAIQLRKEITGEWAMIVSGILSILFAVALALFPGAGAIGLVWMIAAYAIVFGILLIALAFRLRGTRQNNSAMPGAQA